MSIAGGGMRDAGCVALALAVATLPASPIPLPAQRPQPFDQQLRDNQRRLEDIRRERTEVERELERLKTQVHSLSDELSNLERQKETTNRIVNELDRQINGISGQIDRTTVDLLLAQDALEEKRAVLDHRLVDIYKRGPLYTYQVLLAAESFGDLLSRYKYLYLVSRQDHLPVRRRARAQQHPDPLARHRDRGTRRHAGARHRGRHREPRRAARHLSHVGPARSRRRVLQLLRLPRRGHCHQGRTGRERPGHRARRRRVERPGAAPPLRDARARRNRPGSDQLAKGA